jgi:hypothetical protein
MRDRLNRPTETHALLGHVDLQLREAGGSAVQIAGDVRRCKRRRAVRARATCLCTCWSNSPTRRKHENVRGSQKPHDGLSFTPSFTTIGKACATGDGSKGREFRRANRALAKNRVRLTFTGDPLSCIAWFLEFVQRAKVLTAA